MGFGTPVAITTNFTYDADGRITARAATAGSLATTESWAYDLSGRTTNHVDTSGIATQTSYSADNLTTTTTSPGGIQVIQQESSDRFPVSVQGNGTVAKFYQHGTAIGPIYAEGMGAGIREQTTYIGAMGSPRWSIKGTDIAGNQDAFQAWPTGGGTTNVISHTRYYAAHEVLDEYESQNNDSIRRVMYNYSPDGKQCYQTTNLLGPVLGDPPSAYRTTASINAIIQIGGTWYDVTTNIFYLADEDEDLLQTSDMIVEGIHLEQLNNFTGTQIAGSKDYDVDGNLTVASTYLDRSHNVVETITSQPNTSIQTAASVYQSGLMISNSTLSAGATIYSYDSLGRTNFIQDPLGNFSTMTYSPYTG